MAASLPILPKMSSTTYAGASVDDVVSPVNRNGLDLMRGIVGRIGKIEERVDIEGVPLATHVGDG